MKIKLHKLLVLILAISVLFTGCVWNENTESNASIKLESGFKLSIPDIPPNCTVPESRGLQFCAYKSDKLEFNINFVILDFYFGGEFSEDLEHAKKSYDYPCFEIYYGHTSGKTVTIKQVKENFISDKYRCETVKTERGFVKEVKFNYSEKIRIPKSAFTEEKGIIILGLQGINQRCAEPKMETICCIAIYYKVTGNIFTGRRVILSDKPFE